MVGIITVKLLSTSEQSALSRLPVARASGCGAVYREVEADGAAVGSGSLREPVALSMVGRGLTPAR